DPIYSSPLSCTALLAHGGGVAYCTRFILPRHPRHVGLVNQPMSAAVQDPGNWQKERSVRRTITLLPFLAVRRSAEL
uniref:Uncharacterized protein n=1 Tax=Oryza brachyantha TaxID=4533 RepID=J3LHI5_ORYBR